MPILNEKEMRINGLPFSEFADMRDIIITGLKTELDQLREDCYKMVQAIQNQENMIKTLTDIRRILKPESKIKNFIKKFIWGNK